VNVKGGKPSVLFGLEFGDTVGSAKSGITTAHAECTPKTNSEDSFNLNNLNALKNIVVLKSKQGNSQSIVRLANQYMTRS
jgi:hypothetical protein